MVQVDLFARQEVRDFAYNMEKVLRDNDHKSGWAGEDLDILFELLRQEVEELEDSLESSFNPLEYRKAVKKECIDVANFCMMIFSNLEENDES